MQNYFASLGDFCVANVTKDEYISGYFSAEEMDFARINHAKIRQAGLIKQSYLHLRLVASGKEVSISLGLSLKKEQDEALIKNSILKLREKFKHIAKNPFVFINQEKSDSIFDGKDEGLNKDEIISHLLGSSKGLDLVGYFVCGPIYKGFFNSIGQRNWYKKSSFMIDTSIYYKGDQAVKQNYADIKFDKNILQEKLSEARSGLELFSLGKQNLSPGNFHVYFSPSAVYEILSLLNYSGFSYKSIATKSSPILSLKERKKTFNKQFSLYDNSLTAIGPNFQEDGFLKPDKLVIVERGEFKNAAISPKTAKEYDLNHNGASSSESLVSMDMAAGDLAKNDILNTLNNGLYINNLWYLNYSDKINGYITGMTRFLCYTVKDGKPQKSFGVMRFDESIYNIFGQNLLHLTKEREFILDNSTYDERATSSALLPGILVKDVRFTL